MTPTQKRLREIEERLKACDDKNFLFSEDCIFLTQALTLALGALERECCCTGERSLIAPYDFVKCDACESLERIAQLAADKESGG